MSVVNLRPMVSRLTLDHPMPISLPSIALASVDSSSVPAPVGLSTERLTRAEIHARYPNQWVVLVAVEYEGDLLSEIRSAIVAGAGGSEESLEQADPYIAHYGWFAREHTRPADAPRKWDVGERPWPSPL